MQFESAEKVKIMTKDYPLQPKLEITGCIPAWWSPGHCHCCCCHMYLKSTALTIGTAFSAFMLLVGQQERHPACKNRVVGCWHGCLSEASCRLACHCHSLSLALVKSRWVLPFWYRLTRVVPEKGPLNVWDCVTIGTMRQIWQNKNHFVHFREVNIESLDQVHCTNVSQLSVEKTVN